MKLFHSAVLVLVLLSSFFTGCASNHSAAQILAEDSYAVYLETYKAYAEAEERYMNVLFNLERMPEEEELWIMKRSLIVELEHFSEYAIVKVATIKDDSKEDDKTEGTLTDTEEGKTDKNADEGELIENEADKSITGAAKDEKANVVQTGDNIYLYVLILGICVIGIVIIVKRKFSLKK